MLCPHCGTEYEDSEPVCTKCGRSPYIPKHLRKKNKIPGISKQPSILKSAKKDPPLPAVPKAAALPDGVLPGAAERTPLPSVVESISEESAGAWEPAPVASDPAWARAEAGTKGKDRTEVPAAEPGTEHEKESTKSEDTIQEEFPKEIVEVQACGFWRRAAAFLVDAPMMLALAAIISSLLYLVLAIVSGESLGSLFPRAREHGIDYIVDLAITGPGLLLPGIAGLLLGLIAYRLAFKEKTPGRKALKLKLVTRNDGAEPGLLTSTARSFLLFASTLVLGIGPLWAGFDRERRALHDRLCSTLVIKVE